MNRFAGEHGPRRIVDSIEGQAIVAGQAHIAKELAELATIVSTPAGSTLIEQDAPDIDLFLVLAGRFRVLVNGREVAVREAGDHVGEMSLIDPKAPRSATVVALVDSVSAKITEPDFTRIAQREPQLWRAIAKELGNRLRQRSRFHEPPNDRPQVFVASSTKGLRIAQQIQGGFAHDDFHVFLWTDGVFSASEFPLDSLDDAMRIADFGIIVATPDDALSSGGSEVRAPRDNVVFECGLSMGALGRRRTYLIQPRDADLKIPSDLFGLTALKYAIGPEGSLASALGPICSELRERFAALGVK